jgi:hypothetical protein
MSVASARRSPALIAQIPRAKAPFQHNIQNYLSLPVFNTGSDLLQRSLIASNMEFARAL